MNYKIAGLAVFALMILGGGASQAEAYTYGGYTTSSREEFIAHLYQIIAQLQSQVGSGSTATTAYGVTLRTLGATDVDDQSARVGGNITLSSGTSASVWFEYGTDRDMELDTEDARASSGASYNFYSDLEDLEEGETYYFRAVAETGSGNRVNGATRTFDTSGDSDDNDDDDDDDNDNDGDEPDVTTEDAENVEDDTAELNGEVDMNDFEDGTVFFVYGQDEDMVEEVEDEFDTYDDVDEDGDDLQKLEVESGFDDEDSFSEEVSNLEEDAEYFFQICVEYEDDNNDDRITCGGVESFDSDEGDGGTDNGDEPTVTTEMAENIEDDEAELRGEVDMNDFDNGDVFFVFGQDEDMVEEVENEFDTYDAIVEDGDDLEKERVDSDLSDSASYELRAGGLDEETDYFFQICVEYEDEDNDEQLVCGGVEEFTTEN